MQHRTTLLGLALLSLTAACRHTPIPPDRQAAFFRCDGETLQTVEARLATAGYPMQAVTDQTITTGTVVVDFRERTNGKYGFRYADGQRVAIARDRYTSSFVVVRAGDDVTFSLFVEGVKIDPIIQEQLDSEVSRAELNHLRTIVCGAPLL